MTKRDGKEEDRDEQRGKTEGERMEICAYYQQNRSNSLKATKAAL